MTRLAWIACGLAAVVAAAAEQSPVDRPAAEFVRVHVAGDKVADVPLGDERHVPMPTPEFERAVARLQPAAVRRGTPGWIADAATYECSVVEGRRLEGRLRFDLGASAADLAGDVVLGPVDARTGVMTTADGVGDAVVFGMPSGDVAMRTPGPGRYECDFSITAGAPTAAAIVLPLVPALATTVQLDLPAGMVPRFSDDDATAVITEVPADAADARRSWRIEAGPATDATVVITTRESLPPRLRIWTRAELHPRRVDLVARVVPDAPWPAGRLFLRADSGFVPTGAGAVTGGDIAIRDVQRTGFSIDLPAPLVGSITPVEIRGTADMAGAAAREVPLVRPPADRWAGGGVTVVVDPDFVIAGTALEEFLAVPPETAAGWPMPPAVADDADAACLHAEQQSPGSRMLVELQPREAELDVARVTTVEIAPAAVLGRAACDVRVMAGEAFGLTARVGPGWFIDSVEAVEWVATEAEGDDAVDAASLAPAVAVPTTDRAIDWRIVRTPTSSELRIGLAEAATRTRGLGLRITGHRSGVPIGGEFLTSDMDMVRLDGEREGSALVDFRVGAEEVIEIGGDAVGLLPAEGRLTKLVEPGTPRGRIRGGARSPVREARLVQRRPPLTADVVVSLVAGEGRLSQTTTFTCRPDAGVLDAIVVHGSAPAADDWQWSVVSPATATVVARRLDDADDQRGQLARQPGVSQSWLLEFRPPVPGEVVFQSTRTLPFTDPVPVPLAWVEGCTMSRGTVEIRGAGREPPRIVNHGLREVPPPAAEAGDANGPLAELAYGEPRATATAAGPGAMLVPAAAATGRAWAWREVTSCTCHASGRIECDVEYEIENRGRETVTLGVPEGLRVDDVLIDGVSVAVDAPPVAGGDLQVGLPAGRDRVRLVLRGVADRRPRLGLWRIDPIAVAIDMPVLGRALELMLPPDVELVSGGTTGPGESWLARLFDAEPDAGQRSSGDAGDALGFRRVEVPVARAAASRPLVARRSLIASAALLAGMAAAGAAVLLMRRRPSAVVLAAVGLAIAALWVDPGVASIVRGGWWGLLAGAWCAGSARGAAQAAAGLVLAVASTPVTADELTVATPPYRVLLAPGENGGTALVPEPLYRLLAADDDAAAAAVRVVSSRMLAGDTGTDDWRLVVEIDADRGGVLVLDQRAAGSRWLPPVGRMPPGVLVEVDATATLARLVALTPGRHRVEFGIAPAISRRGGVETLTACVPPAPRSTIELVAAGDDPSRPDTRRVLCDLATRGGPWIRAVERDGLFDVSRAARVRLTRAVDPRGGVAALVPQARSDNDVIWSGDGCQVEAAFEIDAGTTIVPSVIVRASPGLEPLPPADASCSPLGGGRFLLERTEPTAGRSRIAVTFTMPLIDPVGVFEAPEAWLEGVGVDDRTVRFIAPATLEVTPELPGSVSLVRGREPQRPDVVAEWRSEALGAGGESATAGAVREPLPAERQRPRVAVRRRAQPPRGSQRLQVTFAEAHVGLGLVCQIESASTPLTEIPVDLPEDCVVDRVVVEREADDQAVPVDVAVMRRSATRIAVVVQRPRSGRFRLRVDARLPGPPAARGRLPLARAVLPGEVPLVLTWLAEGGRGVEVSGAVPRSVTSGLVPLEGDDFIEVPSGEDGPGYVLAEADTAETVAGPPAVAGSTPAEAAPSATAVELTTVHLVLEPRGRVWGTTRFDLSGGDRRVRLQLPAGMRLFDTLVDGRAVEAVPEAADTWLVTLDDVRWPRSLVVVFAGDLAGGLDGGPALRLEPPRLAGMPAALVLWSIDPPPGMQLRVAEPVASVTAAAWNEAAAEARGRLADAFTAAIEAAEGTERARLSALAARRAASGTLPREEALESAVAAADDRSRRRVLVAVAGDAPLTVRAARAIDPTVPTRGLVTVGLVAALAVGWSVAGRWPAACAAAIRWAWPWIAMLAGGVWVLTLEPMLPGWAILAVGGIVATARRLRPAAPAASGATDDLAYGSTRTLLVR